MEEEGNYDVEKPTHETWMESDCMCYLKIKRSIPKHLNIPCSFLIELTI